MFVKPNTDTELIFIKSKYINVFPCGRRRSELVDADNNNNTVSDQYYIPFDPEARLNTEANNRKHSGLNGFTQSFLNKCWEDGKNLYISLVLNGYLFDITAPYTALAAQLEGTTVLSKGKDPFSYVKDDPVNALGDALVEIFVKAAENSNNANTATKVNEATALYANIKLADVSFFSGSSLVDLGTHSTEILRDHSTENDSPAVCLDMLISGKDKRKGDSYYFSGLSFSHQDGCIIDRDILSFSLLVKENNKWKINEQFRLPKLGHGKTVDSVEIYGDLTVGNELKDAEGRVIKGSTFSGDVTVGGNLKVGAGADGGSLTVIGDVDVAGAVTAEAIQIKDKDGNTRPVTTLEVVETTAGVYKLQFIGANIKHLS